jgi:aminoglycoside 6'-N-acetyltransferase I
MVKRAQRKDLAAVAQLACQLWPDHDLQEMEADMSQILEKPDAAFFLAWEGDSAVGFAQCQLRHDYVEGTESTPVGYLEGIYVAEEFRKRGLAKALLSVCQDWAKDQGCCEFASDCELTNTESLQFHLRAGFLEANRLICFTKKL